MGSFIKGVTSVCEIVQSNVYGFISPITSKTKEVVTHFFSNDPLYVASFRLKLQDSDPIASKQLLEASTQRLNDFFLRQPPDRQGTLPPVSPAPSPPTPSTSPRSALDPAILQGQRNTTDMTLHRLSRNLSLLAELSYLSWAAGINDPAQTFQLIQQASSIPPGTVSAKELFLQKYDSRLSFAQKFWIWLCCLFIPSKGFEKTVSKLTESILFSMRHGIANPTWVERGKYTERIISDLVLLLDVHLAATLDYAKQVNPQITLEAFREQRFEQMYGKTYETLSTELVDRVLKDFFPTVTYFDETDALVPSFARFLNRCLNEVVVWKTRELLPAEITSTIRQINETTQPHNLPFAKALADTFRVQLEELSARIDAETGPDLPPLTGTDKLDNALKTLYTIVQYQDCTSQSAIREKEQELGHTPSGLTKQVQDGLQRAMNRGTQVLLRTFPERSEEIFGMFFGLANQVFAEGQVVTPEEFSQSKENLYMAFSDLGNKVASLEIKKIFEPEQSSDSPSVQEPFRDRKAEGEKASQILEQIYREVQRKTPQAETRWTAENDILAELGSMHKVLDGFVRSSKKEKYAEGLPIFHKDAVTRPFWASYETVQHLSSELVLLQDLQLGQKARFQIARGFQEILEGLDNLRPGDMYSAQQMATLEAVVRRIETFVTGPELREVPFNSEIIKNDPVKMGERKAKIQALSRAKDELHQNLSALKENLESVRTADGNLHNLGDLEYQIRNLLAANEQNLPTRKRFAINEIRRCLNLLPEEKQRVIRPIINELSTLPIPRDQRRFDPLWSQLSAQFTQMQEVHTAVKQSASSAFATRMATFQSFIKNEQDLYDRLQTKDRTALIQRVNALNVSVEKLKHQMTRIEPEKTLLLSPVNPIKVTFSGLTFLTGFISPLTSAIGAGAAYGLGKRIDSFINEGVTKNTVSSALSATVLGSIAFGAIANTITSFPYLNLAPFAGLVAAVSVAQTIDRGVKQIKIGTEKHLTDEITRFAKKAFDLSLNGGLPQAGIKLAMHAVVSE